MTTENAAQLNRYLYHDEVEALERSWTPRPDGVREDIIYEGRALLLNGQPKIADDVYIRLITDNRAELILFQEGHPFREHSVVPEKSAVLLKGGLIVNRIKGAG